MNAEFNYKTSTWRYDQHHIVTLFASLYSLEYRLTLSLK